MKKIIKKAALILLAISSYFPIVAQAQPIHEIEAEEKSGQVREQKAQNPQKGKLLYENAFAKTADLKGWIMEGPGKTEFRDGWMHLFAPGEEGHHVYWCPRDFPASFIAEWELQNIETDAGLCILFFAATGIQGEDIFDPKLLPRDGVFRKYTKSDLNCYHISYYANADANGRLISHLRKNKGFNKVQIGENGIPIASTAIHKEKLIKQDQWIRMYIDDRKIIDWEDDGETYGPVLGAGKIGFRQMQWTHFRYRNFKVWEAVHPASKSWPRHTIDNSSSGADGVKLADLNQDGLTDIVTGWEEGGLTKVYLHPGAKETKQKWPAVIVGQTPNVEDAVFMDMNGDGQLDVVSSTEKNSEKIFVHLGPKRKWLQAGKWKQQILPASDGRMRWMYAEPLQLDGRYGTDLVAAGKGENAQIGWFEAPAKAKHWNKWIWHSISPVGWVMSLVKRDMDSDGDMDLIITDRYGSQQGCRWLENPGHPEAQKKEWTSHFIGGKGLEVMFMTMADMNGDGTEEAVVAERSKETVRIFKRKNGTGMDWEELILKLPASTGHAKSVEAGDLNGDGVPDLVISTNTGDQAKNGLIWLDGKKINRRETTDFQTISGMHKAKYDKVELLDIDLDGDLDILICEENYGEHSEGLGVVWYENQHQK